MANEFNSWQKCASYLLVPSEKWPYLAGSTDLKIQCKSGTITWLGESGFSTEVWLNNQNWKQFKNKFIVNEHLHGYHRLWALGKCPSPQHLYIGKIRLCIAAFLPFSCQLSPQTTTVNTCYHAHLYIFLFFSFILKHFDVFIHFSSMTYGSFSAKPLQHGYALYFIVPHRPNQCISYTMFIPLDWIHIFICVPLLVNLGARNF